MKQYTAIPILDIITLDNISALKPGDYLFFDYNGACEFSAWDGFNESMIEWWSKQIPLKIKTIAVGRTHLRIRVVEFVGEWYYEFKNNLLYMYYIPDYKG